MIRVFLGVFLLLTSISLVFKGHHSFGAAAAVLGIIFLLLLIPGLSGVIRGGAVTGYRYAAPRARTAAQAAAIHAAANVAIARARVGNMRNQAAGAIQTSPFLWPGIAAGILSFLLLFAAFFSGSLWLFLLVVILLVASICLFLSHNNKWPDVKSKVNEGLDWVATKIQLKPWLYMGVLFVGVSVLFFLGFIWDASLIPWYENKFLHTSVLLTLLATVFLIIHFDKVGVVWGTILEAIWEALKFFAACARGKKGGDVATFMWSMGLFAYFCLAPVNQDQAIILVVASIVLFAAAGIFLGYRLKKG